MADGLNRMQVRIDADTNPLTRALSNATARLRQFATTTNSVSQNTNGMANSMGNAGRATESLSDRMRRWQSQLDRSDSSLGRFTRSIGKMGSAISDTASSMVSMTAKSAKFAAAIGGIGAAATPVAGLVGAIGASALSASAGLAALAMAAIPVGKEVSDTASKIKEYNDIMNDDGAGAKAKTAAELRLAQLYREQSPVILKAAESLNKLKGKYMDLAKEFEKPIAKGMTTGLQIAINLLDKVKPIIRATIPAVQGLIDTFNQQLNTGQFDSIFKWIEKTSANSIKSLVTMAGYLTKGIFSFFQAFTPLMKTTEGGLVKMSKAFADWSAKLGENNGFKAFLEYTKVNAPLLGSIFKNTMGIIGDAIKLIAVVAAPAVHWILDLVNKFLVWRNSIKVSQVLISNFKDDVIAGFQKLKTFVQPAIAAVSSFVGQKIKEIKKFWQTDGAQFVQAVQNAFTIIKKIVEFVMPAVLWIIKSVWQNIKGVIDGALKIIMG
ncbi:phage tail protein [Priestia megaterium]|uniref:phage tail protein n=1 Tax=Priestia megaterium TaxID=1404 RepID=UPI003CC6CCA3